MHWYNLSSFQHLIQPASQQPVSRDSLSILPPANHFVNSVLSILWLYVKCMRILRISCAIRRVDDKNSHLCSYIPFYDYFDIWYCSSEALLFVRSLLFSLPYCLSSLLSPLFPLLYSKSLFLTEGKEQKSKMSKSFAPSRTFLRVIISHSPYAEISVLCSLPAHY